jgi:serine/threonine-protein kinase
MEEEEDLHESDADSDDDFLRAVARAPAARPPPAETAEPTRVAQFRIVERIGRGGMGIVYRAEDEKLERVVALKVLPEDFDDDASRKRRFLREARVAASLAHANVATVHEVGEADGRIFIAMELVEGRTLRHVLDGDRLAIPEALRITREIVRGVSLAHERGIAHRDLKPDNVMVRDDGVVKVLDFGLAKPVDVTPRDAETMSWTQEGRILGTPGYMSPEQATGRPVDVRTDVFAIGVLLYEMLTGKRPFVGDTSMDILMATSRDEPVPIRKLAPRVSPALATIVERCLAKSKDERFASAVDLLAALDTVDSPEARAASKTVRFVLATSIAALFAFGASRMFASPPPVHADPTTPPPPSVAQAAVPSPASAASPPLPPPSSTAAAASAPSKVVRPASSVAVRPPAPPAAVSVAAPPPPASPRGGVIETSPY